MKRIVLTACAVTMLGLVFCGDETGPSESPTAGLHADTTAIRNILAANGLGTLPVGFSIAYRQDTDGKPRIIKLFLTPGKLGGAKLTTLTSDIGTLTALQELRLDSNLLTELPSQIGNLDNLSTLTITHNNLAALPPQIGGLDMLITLKINNNALSSLPGEIGQLSRLVTLVADNNQLQALPDGMATLSSIFTFTFYGNRVCGPLSATIISWLESVPYWSGVNWNDAPSWQSETGQTCPYFP